MWPTGRTLPPPELLPRYILTKKIYISFEKSQKSASAVELQRSPRRKKKTDPKVESGSGSTDPRMVRKMTTIRNLPKIDRSVKLFKRFIVMNIWWFNCKNNLNWFQVVGTPQDKKPVSNGSGKNEDPDLVNHSRWVWFHVETVLRRKMIFKNNDFKGKTVTRLTTFLIFGLICFRKIWAVS